MLAQENTNSKESVPKWPVFLLDEKKQGAMLEPCLLPDAIMPIGADAVFAGGA